ncbi:S-layer homology domain-containing protein [Thermoproteota archaeon]
MKKQIMSWIRPLAISSLFLILISVQLSAFGVINIRTEPNQINKLVKENKDTPLNPEMVGEKDKVSEPDTNIIGREGVAKEDASVKSTKDIDKQIVQSIFEMDKAAAGKDSAAPAEPLPAGLKDDIGAEYAEWISLYYPEKDLVTYKNKIMVKGINRYLTGVFVNGKKINVASDGRFSSEAVLSDAGKQNVILSFTTPKYEILNIRRKVLRVIAPSDIEDYPSYKTTLTNFYNTDLIHNAQNKPLSTPVTRADLAYFTTKIMGVKPGLVNLPVYMDVLPDHFAAPSIQYVADNSLMAEYPDNTFKPSKSVKKMEYIITIARALNLPMHKLVAKLPYSDVDSSHWTAKYVKAALDAGYIKPAPVLLPDKDMTMADLAMMAVNLPAVQTAIANVVNFRNGFGMSAEELAAYTTPVQNFLNGRYTAVQTQKNLVFDSPKPNQFVYSNAVTFKGTINPAQTFTINDLEIMPNVNGVFQKDFPVGKGKNLFVIRALDQVSTMAVNVMASYQDLQGHWLENAAAKLRAINVASDAQNYYPRRSLTRKEMAVFLTRAFDLKLSNANYQSSARDLKANSPYDNAVRTVLENGILTLDKKSQFNPDKKVTRAEALVAVIRASKTKSQTASFFPYRDVLKNHWVRPFVETALSARMITAMDRYYPSRAINRAEFSALLMKTNRVQEKIKAIMNK